MIRIVDIKACIQLVIVSSNNHPLLVTILEDHRQE